MSDPVKQTPDRSVTRPALQLAGIGLLAVALLAGTYALTRERIAEHARQAQMRALAIVMPPARYNNDLITDQIQVIAPSWLGVDRPLTVRRARRDEQAAGLILEAIAADGYSGAIRLLIGVDASGRILAVRVTEHKETPGLGDVIEAEKSNWINDFSGQSIDDPALPDWRVQKDGGQFDQFAGATITPRAVVGAVRRALQFVQLHGDELYSAKNEATLGFRDEPQTIDQTSEPSSGNNQ